MFRKKMSFDLFLFWKLFTYKTFSKQNKNHKIEIICSWETSPFLRQTKNRFSIWGLKVVAFIESNDYISKVNLDSKQWQT